MTVTIALTSLAPRARYSFWKASAVYDTLGTPYALVVVRSVVSGSAGVAAGRGVTAAVGIGVAAGVYLMIRVSPLLAATPEVA